MSKRKPIRLAGAALDRPRHVCGFFNGKDDEYAALSAASDRFRPVTGRTAVPAIVRARYRAEAPAHPRTPPAA